MHDEQLATRSGLDDPPSALARDALEVRFDSTQFSGVSGIDDALERLLSGRSKDTVIVDLQGHA